MSETGGQSRVLVVLSVVQIAALIFLFAKVMGIGARMDAVVAVQSTPVEAAPSQPRIFEREKNSGQNKESLTANQVRRIVREELRAQLSAISAPTNTRDPVVNRIDEIDDQNQLDSVDQELEFYISQGTISEVEMATLQQEIAKLGPEGRREMLRRLIQALNSGELDGRL